MSVIADRLKAYLHAEAAVENAEKELRQAGKGMDAAATVAQKALKELGMAVRQHVRKRLAVNLDGQIYVVTIEENPEALSKEEAYIYRVEALPTVNADG